MQNGLFDFLLRDSVLGQELVRLCNLSGRFSHIVYNTKIRYCVLRLQIGCFGCLCCALHIHIVRVSCH